MPLSIKVVAFDCDGVLFDSRAANTAFYNQIMTHLGLPPLTDRQSAYAHMHTVDEAIAYLVPDETSRSAAQAYRRRMTYLPFITLMEMDAELVPLLTRLHPHYRTAIATNRTDTMAKVLDHHNLGLFFDLVVTALDVAHPKPHPEQLLTVQRHFAIEPRQLLYVGDSQVDEAAAAAAGVCFVAYRNPRLRADHHVNGMLKLAALLGLN